MTNKEHLIIKIKNFEEKYFNEDQKIIAIDILKNAPEEQVQAYADFIFMKRKTGFAFDYSPEIAKGRLITLHEDKTRRINVGDEIENDENKLIIGDNYNALKALLITHKNKIDVIYIDPPYNTEAAKQDGNQSSKNGQASKFMYKDKFGRGGWLNMMKSRLTLAKDLLSNKGVIFVSIDDSEQAYLKVLMDQIFGENNFVASMPRILKKGGKSNKGISKTHDYVLIYSKNSNTFKFKRLEVMNNSYKMSDKYIKERGKYHLKQTLDYNSLLYNKKMDFVINFNKSEYYPGGINKYNERINGIYKKIDWVWRWSFAKVEAAKKLDFLVQKNGRIYSKTYFNVSLEKVNDKYVVLKKRRRQNIETTNFVLKNKFNNDNAKKKLGQIIEKGFFDYPKPVSLIKDLIDLILNNKNFIILDFFAGSGTTAHAVLELNSEDNGKRKFILCTNNENKIAHNVTYERLHRIIKGIGTNKEKDFEWLIKNKPFSKQKLRVINIDDSTKISLNENVPEKIYDDCQKGLKLLDTNYKKEGINLYYDLAALNPLVNDEDKFKF